MVERAEAGNEIRLKLSKIGLRKTIISCQYMPPKLTFWFNALLRLLPLFCQGSDWIVRWQHFIAGTSYQFCCWYYQSSHQRSNSGWKLIRNKVQQLFFLFVFVGFVVLFYWCLFVCVPIRNPVTHHFLIASCSIPSLKQLNYLSSKFIPVHIFLQFSK